MFEIQIRSIVENEQAVKQHHKSPRLLANEDGIKNTGEGLHLLIERLSFHDVMKEKGRSFFPIRVVPRLRSTVVSRFNVRGLEVALKR